MKKLLTIFGLLIISVSAYGCGNDEPDVSTPEAEDVEVLQNDEDVIAEETISGLEDIETYEEILANEDATSEDCAEIENSEIKSTCEQRFIYDAAIENKSAEMCKQLETEVDQETCIAEIVQ